jgi:MFS family permease
VLKLTSLREIAEYQLLLGTISLPGAIIGAFLVKRIGTRLQLVLGFSGYLILGLIIGLAWTHIIKIPALFVVFYGLFTSMGNLGPGSIAGLQASESYPSALRGTAYGLSAAIGKAGAAIGTQAFTPIQNDLGKQYTFIIAAGIGVVGILVSWFFCIDTSKLDLEAEDREWLAYLQRNGWHGEVGAPEKQDVDFEDAGKSSQSVDDSRSD